MTAIDTANDFMFASNGITIAPLLPVRIATREQAYRTAAWILCMAEILPAGEPSIEFGHVLEAIENT